MMTLPKSSDFKNFARPALGPERVEPYFDLSEIKTALANHGHEGLMRLCL